MIKARANGSDHPFWVVWNPINRPPMMRHESYEAAVREAERLAAMHPGQEFIVLVALTMRTLDSMRRIDFDAIPF